ncbi:MAG: DUF1573 domain-containing protein [Pirellulaceae bacterium]|nr:DUF1573 domain-containing protein [Pirellulaceae bacterium]
MPVRNSHLLFALLVVILLWGAFFLRPGREDISALILDRNSHDFGKVWSTAKFDWTLLIRNKGRSKVEFAEFTSSCNCLTVEPRRLIVGPGETRELRLVLDLTTARAELHGGEAAFAANVVGSTRRGGAVRFRVTGTVLTPLIFDPVEVSFRGGDRITAGETAERLVRLMSNGDVIDVQANCAATLGTVGVHRDGQSWLMYFQLKPHTERGPINEVIHVGCRLPNGNIVHTTIPVRATVVSDIVAIPEVLRLARGQVTSDEQFVLLQSRSADEFVANILEHPQGTRVQLSDNGALKTVTMVVSDSSAFRGGDLVVGVRSRHADEVLTIPVFADERELRWE